MKFVQQMINAEGFNGELPMPLVRFCSDYIGKFGALPALLVKKADQRTLTSRCQAIAKEFEGELTTAELVLNSQLVTITGVRSVTLVAAIRRVAQDHFAEQMCNNPLIHELFGIDLLSRGQALKIIRENKAVIQQDRVANKRQREKAISKDRKKKTKRAEHHLSDEEVE
jgi:hypothetical protein